MTDDKNAFGGQVKQLGVLTVIPLILLVGPTIGFLIGGWIDRKAHVYPWFTILFVFMGFVGSAREIIRLLKQILKDEKENKDSNA